MRLLLTRSESIELTATITLLTLYHLYLLFLVRLGEYIVNLSDFYSYRVIGKRTVFSKVEVLRINLNIDGASITSRTHTHPSHTQTSRLLTSSLSLGVPIPRATQWAFFFPSKWCQRDIARPRLPPFFIPKANKIHFKTLPKIGENHEM